MPTVNVNIPTPPSEAIIDVEVIPFQSLAIDKTKWYRVTNATPVPCLVSGASINESSAFAILEGTSDGTGITSVGGTGTYDLATGTFAYGFGFDPINNITYNRVSPIDNTVGVGANKIIFEQNSNANIVGDGSSLIIFEQNSATNNVGLTSDTIIFGNNCANNIVGDNSGLLIFEQQSSANIVGDGSLRVIFKQGVNAFIFGDNFRWCTIWQGLKGQKADDSGPIDFITGVTFLYNRTSPWEIRDIDRTAELLFLYVTYGDGSDPEEGWYNPATDAFTPIASGGGSVVVPETFTRNGFLQTFGSSSTRYVAVSGNSLNTLTTAAQPAQKVNVGGVIPSVTWITNNAQPGSGSLVITLMKGSSLGSLADTAAVITIAANAAAGEHTYTGDITVADGEYLVLKVVNNASANSAQDGGSSFVINRTIAVS